MNAMCCKRPTGAVWILARCVLVAASCTGCESLTGGAPGNPGRAGLFSSVGSAYADMAGRVEEDALLLESFARSFRAKHGRWPESLKELERFAREQGKSLWLRRMEEVSFDSKADGRLVVTGDYLEPGFDDSNDSPGSPMRDRVVVLIAPDQGLRIIVDPDDMKEYR